LVLLTAGLTGCGIQVVRTNPMNGDTGVARNAMAKVLRIATKSIYFPMSWHVNY